MALALCSSLLEREKELEREAAAALAAVAPRLQWRAEAGACVRACGHRRSLTVVMCGTQWRAIAAKALRAKGPRLGLLDSGKKNHNPDYFG